MADDRTSTPVVKRLRDGLRLVSTVVQAFAETTSDYRRLLDAIARNIAEAIPDICMVMLRSGEALTLVAIHDGAPGADVRLRHVRDQSHPLTEAGISASVLAHGPLFMPRIDFAALGAHMPAESVDRLRRGDATGLL